MKNSRNERLSEHLLNVDEEIFANAYEIDDAEKLRKYIRTKNAKTKKPFYMTPAFRRVATIAACFVLIIGVMFSIPTLFNQGNDDTNKDPDNDRNHLEEVTPPWLKGEEGYLTINSIAQLNYYAAIRMLTEEPNVTGLSMTSFKTTGANYGIVLLSAGSDVDKNDEPPIPETTGPNASQEPAVTPNNPTSPNPDEDIYYYSLDPNEPFYINRVSMFQIELTDEEGFLASKLGLGIVDVVITEECIWGESLITFRKGENFYSCLTNGGGYNHQTGEWYWDFSTHKYVEGFFIVKNLAQENYGFNIKMDAQGQAYKFNCHETENGGNRVDKNVKVVSSTVVSEEGRSFTVAELENYFNTGKMPDEIESVLGTGNAVSGEMPKDTTLEFWITEDVKDRDWSGYDEIYGWMGAREFLGSAYKKNVDSDGSDQHPEHYVSYVITAWPDYADGGQFVTDITVTDPAVKVYGLTIASTFEEFDAVFEPLGYELSWGEGAIETRVATKNGITFRLTRAVEDNPDVVPQIRISAEVTNREGIVY